MKAKRDFNDKEVKTHYAPECPRCSREMWYLHGSWQCRYCKYKEGCCS